MSLYTVESTAFYPELITICCLNKRWAENVGSIYCFVNRRRVWKTVLLGNMKMKIKGLIQTDNDPNKSLFTM